MPKQISKLDWSNGQINLATVDLVTSYKKNGLEFVKEVVSRMNSRIHPVVLQRAWAWINNDEFSSWAFVYTCEQDNKEIGMI